MLRDLTGIAIIAAASVILAIGTDNLLHSWYLDPGLRPRRGGGFIVGDDPPAPGTTARGTAPPVSRRPQ